MPDVGRALLSISPPRDAATRILLDIEESEEFSIKIRNYILIDYEHFHAKFMKSLSRKSQSSEIGNLSSMHLSLEESGKDLGNSCSKLAQFCFEYANLIRKLSKGNFSPQIPSFAFD